MDDLNKDQIVLIASALSRILGEAKKQESPGSGDGFVIEYVRSAFAILQKTSAIPGIGLLRWEDVSPVILPVAQGVTSFVSFLMEKTGLSDRSFPSSDDLLPTPSGVRISGNTISIGAEDHEILFSADDSKVSLTIKEGKYSDA